VEHNNLAITVTVTSDIAYIPTPTREAELKFPLVVNFTATGSGVAWTPSDNGLYRIQLWGAAGGSVTQGRGGYVEGRIMLTTADTLYIYVGTKGGENNNNYGGAGGWNGGGNGGNGYSTADIGGYGGGGASDVRLVGGAWDNLTSLYSRILVAGGGGGVGGGWIGTEAGGLVAENAHRTGSLSTIPGGGQTTPPTTTLYIGIGTKGRGANGGDGTNYTDSVLGHGGGGGGYYGGCTGATVYGTKFNSSGAGGSSFISGLNNCDTTYRSTHILPSGSNPVLIIEPVVLDGDKTFSAPDGSDEMGHRSSGHVRISVVQ
jgi:hypothetical protein